MKTGIGRQFVAIVLAVILARPAIGIPSAEASVVDGAWVIRDLVLTMFDCEHLVCGRIAWLKDPARRPAQCGQVIVWGLAEDGPSTWSGGSIFDPKDGTTYRLSATLEPDGTLNARIFRGIPIFGKTEILKRIDLHSLVGLC